ILSLFFLLIRPPTRSTLFPYTTLFRSRHSPSQESSPSSSGSELGGQDRCSPPVTGVALVVARSNLRSGPCFLKLILLANLSLQWSLHGASGCRSVLSGDRATVPAWTSSPRG